MSRRRKRKKLGKINFDFISQLLDNPIPIKPNKFSMKIRCKECHSPAVLSIQMAEEDNAIDVFLECPFCELMEVLYTIEDEEIFEINEGEITEELPEKNVTITEYDYNKNKKNDTVCNSHITQDPRK